VIIHGKGEVEVATRVEIGEEGLDDAGPDAGGLPATIMLVTGLPGGRGGRDIVPRLTGGELPEDGLEDGAHIGSRAATGGGGREDRLEEGPLVVGEEHER